MAINFSTYRTNDIDSKLTQARFRPLDVMVTGVTGAGKSTTLNSFFQKTVAKVGDGVDPETMELDAYQLNDIFRVWDTPGLGDGVEIDKIHKKKMVDLLYKTYSLDGNAYGFIDIALIVIEGSNRDMGTTYTLLNEVIVPNIQRDRIFVVINQADVAMKGRHWNYETNTPDTQLVNFLEQQAYSIQKRVKEATGVNILKPVYYSAEYGYNVKAVFDLIIDHMPLQRRPLIK
jgi:predicted GTPase